MTGRISPPDKYEAYAALVAADRHLIWLEPMLRKILKAMLLVASISMTAFPSFAQEITPQASPRDLYVSCSLFLHQTDVVNRDSVYTPYKMQTCGTLTLAMIANLEGRSENALGFCIGDSPINPAMQIADAYIRFFEKSYFRLSSKSVNGAPITGEQLMMVALNSELPCK